MKLFLVLVALVAAVSAQSIHDLKLGDFLELTKVAPKLSAMVARALSEPETVAKELQTSHIAAIAREIEVPTEVAAKASAYPIVAAHGMGDSCFNPGMASVAKAAGVKMGVYSVCIPTGSTQSSDTMNGFFMTMDKNVDVFAAAIKNDTKLAGGFNAFGLSQGNSVIRGYIERYNDPPVMNYLSIHGTVMGVASFPQCDPKGLFGPVCDILAEITGDLAYNSLVQSILFQANYYRDPMLLKSTGYLTYSQLAQWNNEAAPHPTWTTNFEAVNSYQMIRAMGDTMIFPSIGEWWGQFAPGSFKTEQSMNETDLYASNAFGLKTLNQAGKIKFNHTDGNHLQFTDEQLYWWLEAQFSA